MHTLVNHVQSTVARCKVPLKDKSKALELITAECLAQCLSIPATPVEDLSSYFLAHCKVQVMEQLAEVNECTVIDVDRTASLVFSVWKLRYCLVHRPSDSNAGRLMAHAVNGDCAMIPPMYREILRNYSEVALKRHQIEDVVSEVNDGH